MQQSKSLIVNFIHQKGAIKTFVQSSFIHSGVKSLLGTSVNTVQQEEQQQHQQQHLQQFYKSQVEKECIERVDIVSPSRTLNLTFEDSTKGFLPYLWLRDNCQCPFCFNKNALGRSFLLQNLDLKSFPVEVKNEGHNLRVVWNDNHTSDFDSKWLYERAFTSQARRNYKNLHRLQMHPWGRDVKLDIFNYNELMKNDEVLLKWLLTMEVKGVTIIKNSPEDDDAGPKFIDHVGFVKPTHYGRRSPVIIRENTNNLAFSNVKLGLHNDLPQYYHQPGIILIHTVKQHRGTGGESTISDGLLAAEILRRQSPTAFDILTKTNVYFWDKGQANINMESDEFYKINKGPIIGLKCDNEFEIMRVNNQIRDSHLDLPPDKVNSFYEAMKQLIDILQDNSYSFKMEDGDILALDNVRCLHGREKFDNHSQRHLESSYLDWDETLCKRRRLLEKLAIHYQTQVF